VSATCGRSNGSSQTRGAGRFYAFRSGRTPGCRRAGSGRSRRRRAHSLARGAAPRSRAGRGARPGAARPCPGWTRAGDAPRRGGRERPGHCRRHRTCAGASRRAAALAPDDEEQREISGRAMLEHARADEGNQRSSGEVSHRIVSSRCAPVEIRQKGTPISSSAARRSGAPSRADRPRSWRRSWSRASLRSPRRQARPRPRPFRPRESP